MQQEWDFWEGSARDSSNFIYLNSLLKTAVFSYFSQEAFEVFTESSLGSEELQRATSIFAAVEVHISEKAPLKWELDWECLN